MICKNCGMENKGDSNFCTKCGGVLDSATTNNVVEVNRNQAQLIEISSGTNEKPSRGKAIAGFICSLCGILTCGISSIVGLILSIIGLSESRKRGETDGLAIAGIIFSSLFILFMLFSFVSGVISPDSNNNNNTGYSNYESEESSITSNESNENTNNSTVESSTEYIKVTVDELENKLDENAALAKETYNGKLLEITGKLKVIDSDLKYIGIYAMEDDWDFIGIHCKLKDSANKEKVKTLTTGQTITVRGKVTSVGEVLGYYVDVKEIIAQ